MTQELIKFSPQDLQIITEFYQLERNMKEMKKRQDLLRADLVDIMEDYAVKSWDNDKLKATYIPEGETVRFDSTAFKKDHPELAKQYEKVSKRKASVRVTLKDQE